MRVPLFIVIPLCIITLLGVWFSGTHNKDFVTPPSPDQLEDITEKWKAEQPEGTPHITKVEAPTPQIVVEKKEVIEKEPEPLPLLPTGDLTKSPSLSEYGVFNEKGSAELIRLATHLTEQKSPQRALLAWERVLDMTTPDDTQRQQAIAAISQLKQKLSPWNADPVNDIQITLHVNAQAQDPAALKGAILDFANVIQEASDFIIKANVKINNTPPKGNRAALVNIQLSSSATPTENSPSFVLPYHPDKQGEFKELLESSFYQLIRQQLISNTSFSPLPEVSSSEISELTFRHHITRLMWREFGMSFTQPKNDE